MRHKNIIGLVLALVIGASWFLFNNTKDNDLVVLQNKKEIFLYSTLDVTFLNALITEYNSDKERTVLVKLLSAEEVEKGHKADLYLVDYNDLQLLSKEQRLYSVLSEAGDFLPPTFKGESSQWFGVFYDPIVFLVNQGYAREKGQDNIASWQDIIKLKGVRVAMENLSDSRGTIDFLSAFTSIKGEEKSFAYFLGLNQQIPQYSHFPFTPIRLTTMGDADLAITRRSYVFKYLENDFPAYLVMPEEGTPITLYGVGIDSASKKYTEAQLFRDWLLVSREPQKVSLEQNTGYIFLLTNGLRGNHINEPEKLWLNTKYYLRSEQETLINRWLQSVRFAAK